MYHACVTLFFTLNIISVLLITNEMFHATPLKLPPIYTAKIASGLAQAKKDVCHPLTV